MPPPYRVFLDLLTTEPPPQYFITSDQDFEASHYSGVPSAMVGTPLIEQSDHYLARLRG